MSIDFGRVYELGAHRKQEGRPTVWETREVCEETNHCRFASLTYFPCCLLMLKKNVRICAAHLRAPPKHVVPLRCQCLPHLQLSCWCLTPNPSHLFAYMPARTLTAV